MDYKIVKAGIEDLSEVVRLSDLLSKYHHNIDPYYTIYDKYEDHEEFYSNSLKKDSNLYLLAQNESGENIGLASASIIHIPDTDAPKIGKLISNYVLEEYRGQGVGNALFEKRMDWFREGGVKHVESNVDAGNDISLSLLRKKGFKDYQIKLKLDI